MQIRVMDELREYDELSEKPAEQIECSGAMEESSKTSSTRVEDASKKQHIWVKSNLAQMYAALAANFGAFAIGTVLSWTATALPDIREGKELGDVTSSHETYISTLALLGAAVACPTAAKLMDKWGRKISLMILSVPFVIGWLIVAFSVNVYMVYFGRLVTGFCAGGCSLVSPVYVTEISSANIRGMLTAAFDMMITMGISYIFIIGTFVSWRYQAIFCGAVPCLFLLLLCFVKESPRFLLENDRKEEALKSLAWLRGASGDNVVPSHAVVTELNEMEKGIEANSGNSSSMKDIFQPEAWNQTKIVVIVMIFQQLAAIDAIMFYTVDIFQSAGTNIDENLSTILVGLIQVAATIFSAITVDRCGRRLLLLVSELFMFISLGTMGLFFYLKHLENGTTPAGLGWLPLASLMVYVTSFSIGIGPIPWLLGPEIVPSHLKGVATSLVTITRWISGFLITIGFQEVMKAINLFGGYWLFSILCFIGFIYIYFKVPETKGKTLEEIQLCFQQNAPPQ